MKYRESAPSQRFRGYIKCFWSLEQDRFEANQAPEPVVPDGCIEIIFNLSDRFRRFHASGDIETQPASIIAGQMTKSVSIGPSGRVRLFGIRFKPAGAFPFFDFDMSDLANRIEPLDTVWGKLTGEIEERLCSINNFEAQAAVLETFLSRRWNDKTIADPWLVPALDAVSRSNGTLPVRTLARQTGISERGLERRFQRFVGLGPKAYSRIIRFQRVLREFESSHAPNILDTAFSYGYYDQSHLINDFQQFAGTSPRAFFEKAHRMTGLFNSAE